MKRRIKIAALLLSILMLALPILACSSPKDKAVASIGDSYITVYEFEYFLSTYKGALSSAGYDVTSNKFWETAMSLDGDRYKTANEHFTDAIIDNVKTYVCALHLFDEMNLSIPANKVASIDKYMQQLVDSYGNGSRAKLNSELSKYGVNYDILREIYLKQEKLVVLKNALYGSDGSKISDEIKTDFYEKNYVRFNHVFFYTYEMEYEKDSNGDEIYYTANSKIAYDKENGQVRYDANGDPLLDKDKEVIYFNEDGKIAYDKVNGSKAVKRDSSGKPITKEYTKEQLGQVEKNIEDVMAANDSGKYSFDELVELFSEDEGKALYPNGYYLTKESPYDIKAVMDTLFDPKTGEPAMNIGEVKLVRSDLGYHIIKRYELQDMGYKDEKNKDFFTTMIPALSQELFFMKLDEYRELIVFNEELLRSVDMKSVGINKTF